MDVTALLLRNVQNNAKKFNNVYGLISYSLSVSIKNKVLMRYSFC